MIKSRLDLAKLKDKFDSKTKANKSESFLFGKY